MLHFILLNLIILVRGYLAKSGSTNYEANESSKNSFSTREILVQLTTKILQNLSALHCGSAGDLFPALQSLENVTWPHVPECRQFSRARKSSSLPQSLLKHVTDTT
jgi:hypothetical protein